MDSEWLAVQPPVEIQKPGQKIEEEVHIKLVLSSSF